MAQAVAKLYGCDIGLAFGTYAAPSELKTRRPATDVDVAMYGTGLPTEIRSRSIIGHPDILNDRVAKTALDTLRLALGKRGHS